MSYTKNTITKVQALVSLLHDNDGKANWNTIYQKVGLYYPELKHPGNKLSEIEKAGIRGVLYRDCDKGRNIFTKVGNATFALKGSA